MTSVLLIYPFFKPRRDNSQFRFPPLGLGYIAASLRGAGHEVSLLDCTFLGREEAVALAAATRAEMVGVYSMITLREQSLSFARALRDRAGLLVAGGPLPSTDPGLFLSDFDVVVRGEGERTMCDLIAGIRGGARLRRRARRLVQNLGGARRTDRFMAQLRARSAGVRPRRDSLSGARPLSERSIPRARPAEVRIRDHEPHVEQGLPFLLRNSAATPYSGRAAASARLPMS